MEKRIQCLHASQGQGHQKSNMAGKMAKSIFEFSAKLLNGESMSLSSLKGKVVMIQNVASLWGTTVRDYTQMNQLVEQFGDRLAILAFPCNQFGHQVSHKIVLLFFYVFLLRENLDSLSIQYSGKWDNSDSYCIFKIITVFPMWIFSTQHPITFYGACKGPKVSGQILIICLGS